MTAHRAHVVVGDDELELVIDAAWIGGALGVEERPAGGDRTLVIASFDVAESAAQLARRWDGSTDEVADDAGLDDWRAHATRTSTRHWTVVPAWLADDADHHDPRALVLDPGRSFGAGSHQSTQLALDAMVDLPLASASVLDMGCGSGILSIAAARLGAAEVVPVDIDPEALAATDLNAASTGAAAVASAVEHAPERAFDVVLANMLLADVEPLADDLCARVRAGGLLVTTGHLLEQRSRIEAAFDRAEMLDRHELDGWSLMILRFR